MRVRLCIAVIRRDLGKVEVTLGYADTEHGAWEAEQQARVDNTLPHMTFFTRPTSATLEEDTK